VVWRPDTTHTLVQTCDRLLGPLQLLYTGLLEKVCLLQDLAGLHVPYTDRLLAAVDVEALDEGVLLWSGRDPDLNLRVLAGERLEVVLQEGTVKSIV
jgi:hypothetical protein